MSDFSFHCCEGKLDYWDESFTNEDLPETGLVREEVCARVERAKM
jgi:hypothetical protein